MKTNRNPQNAQQTSEKCAKAASASPLPPHTPLSPSPSLTELKAKREEEVPDEEGRRAREVGRVSEAKFVEEWNEAAKVNGWSTAQNMSKKRKRSFAARMREPFFFLNWRGALVRIKDSRFCKGENNRGWRADIDFILTEDGVTKILEGKYDNRGYVATDSRGSKPQLSPAERDLMRMARQCDSRNKKP